MEPLASKLRPVSLDQFIGQEHLVGKNKPLRIAIESKQLFSFLLWGPPGVGKTTLARIYAKSVNAELHELSAVSAGKDDIRKIIGERKQQTLQPVVLFLDEIHRFSKAQQDYLLPFVETGRLTLIGATTENPSFEVIPALLSRLRVFVLEPLSESQLKTIILSSGIKLSDSAADLLVQASGGDARQALTLLDSTSRLYKTITEKNIKLAIENIQIRFDKTGDEHYQNISAFIKSMRASQPDAAIYYLAKMIEGGEDPKFIARRMVVFASEDIGIAQPTALVVANEVFRAVETVGLPECAINLAHGSVYLANCPKNRHSYNALREAQQDVRQFGNLPVPLIARNASTDFLKKIGYGKDYELYTDKSLLPDKLKHKKYFSGRIQPAKTKTTNKKQDG